METFSPSPSYLSLDAPVTPVALVNPSPSSHVIPGVPIIPVIPVIPIIPVIPVIPVNPVNPVTHVTPITLVTCSCSSAQLTKAQYCSVQHTTAHYSPVQYSTAQYSQVLTSIAQYGQIKTLGRQRQLWVGIKSPYTSFACFLHKFKTFVEFLGKTTKQIFETLGVNQIPSYFFCLFFSGLAKLVFASGIQIQTTKVRTNLVLRFFLINGNYHTNTNTNMRGYQPYSGRGRQRQVVVKPSRSSSSS